MCWFEYKRLERRNVIWWRQRIIVHLTSNNLSSKVVRQTWWHKTIFIRVCKTCKFATERKQHVIGSTLTVLSDNNLSLAMKVVSLLILEDTIILWSVYEEH